MGATKSELSKDTKSGMGRGESSSGKSGDQGG